MTPSPNDVVPNEDMNGPSMTGGIPFRTLGLNDRENSQEVRSVAAVIEMGIVKMSPTFLRTGTGPEPAVTTGTAWLVPGARLSTRKSTTTAQEGYLTIGHLRSVHPCHSTHQRQQWPSPHTHSEHAGFRVKAE